MGGTVGQPRNDRGSAVVLLRAYGGEPPIEGRSPTPWPFLTAVTLFQGRRDPNQGLQSPTARAAAPTKGPIDPVQRLIRPASTQLRHAAILPEKP